MQYKHTLHQLWKESLNSDGHQFHQYQQNEQSPLIVIEFTEYTDLGQTKICGGIKSINGTPILPSSKLDIYGNTYKEAKKIFTYSLSLKKTTYYHKNKWQHKHGQYNRRVNECS